MSSGKAVAFPADFKGPAVYATPFESTGFGVIFQDDGDTGYFFATDESQVDILDTLIVYRAGDDDRLNEGEAAYVVYSADAQRAGLYYHGEFQAVFDFRQKTGCCRRGEPDPVGDWCTSGHAWDPEMVKELEKQE